MFTVVVEHGDVRFVVVEAGIVLPLEVGGCAITKISELVSVATENPDRMTILAIDESEKGQMTRRDEIVAILRLRCGQHMNDLEDTDFTYLLDGVDVEEVKA